MKVSPRYQARDIEHEDRVSVHGECTTRKISYQECIEWGLDPAKYGLTPDTPPDPPKPVDPKQNRPSIYKNVTLKGSIDTPEHRKRKSKQAK